MDTTLIRVSEPREILAYVPYNLGFAPRDSLVAVSVRRRGGRLGLVVRVDLDDLARDASGARLAEALAGHLASDGAGQVMLIVYTNTPRSQIRAGLGSAARALARIREALPETVADDAWLVGPSGYAGIDCEDETCCPPAGRRLAELESTEVGAHMVLSGAVVAASRDDLALHVRAPAPARRAARRASTAERSRRRDMAPPGDVAAGRAHYRDWAERTLERWSALRSCAQAGGELPPAELGRMLVALEDLRLRDAVILALVSEATPEPLEPDEALGALLAPGGHPPDPEDLRYARDVLEAIVAHTSPGRSVPALAMLAWLAWWAGDGARCGVLVEQCLEIDPAYGLALLMRDILEAAVPPGWVREPAAVRSWGEQ